jgi:hypothetical protein
MTSTTEIKKYDHLVTFGSRKLRLLTETNSFLLFKKKISEKFGIVGTIDIWYCDNDTGNKCKATSLNDIPENGIILLTKVSSSLGY